MRLSQELTQDFMFQKCKHFFKLRTISDLCQVAFIRHTFAYIGFFFNIAIQAKIQVKEGMKDL